MFQENYVYMYTLPNSPAVFRTYIVFLFSSVNATWVKILSHGPSIIAQYR